MPVSIQGDLAKQPFDILFCQEECLTAANYQFIDKVEVKRQMVSEHITELFRKIFKEGKQFESSNSEELDRLKA